MTERRFNRFFDTCTSRGSRFAATSCACNESACENNNSISLLSLDTALAVSIFAVLRLVLISLVGLIIIRAPQARPGLA